MDGQPSISRAAAAAVASGLASTAATLAITYPTWQAVKEKRELTACQQRMLYLGNLLLCGAAQALGIWANGMGPVAITFPFAVVANILSILLFQWRLGMLHPAKPVRVGTYTLAVAVLMLPNVGPTDQPSDVPVLDLLRTKLAMTFIIACASGMLLCILAIYLRLVKDNTRLLLAYCFIGGAGCVLNTSISKLVQMDLGPIMLPICIGLFVLLSVSGFCVQAVANGTLPDPSLFVPVGAGVNLVLNAVAGLCIWEDAERLKAPFAYAMVIVLVFLGTYSLTSIDFLAGEPHIDHPAELLEPLKATERGLPATGPAEDQDASSCACARSAWARVRSGWDFLWRHAHGHLHYERRAIHKEGLRLRELWSTGGEAEETREALDRYLKHAIRGSLVDAHSLRVLCLKILEHDPNGFQSKVVKQWLYDGVDAFKDTAVHATDSA